MFCQEYFLAEKVWLRHDSFLWHAKKEPDGKGGTEQRKCFRPIHFIQKV